MVGLKERKELKLGGCRVPLSLLGPPVPRAGCWGGANGNGLRSECSGCALSALAGVDGWWRQAGGGAVESFGISGSALPTKRRKLEFTRLVGFAAVYLTK